LIDKGLVKVENFKNSRNKIQYAYLLTPQGMSEKSKLTLHFLQRKTEEYERLKIEIEQLKPFSVHYTVFLHLNSQQTPHFYLFIQQSSAFLPNQPHKYNLEHMSLPKPLVAFGFSV
jgi:hypothetical protein